MAKSKMPTKAEYRRAWKLVYPLVNDNLLCPPNSDVKKCIRSGDDLNCYQCWLDHFLEKAMEETGTARKALNDKLRQLKIDVAKEEK